MKVSVVSRISINASAKDVFKYLSDSSFHFLWNPHLQEIDPIGKLKLGSEYVTTSMMLGVRLHAEIQITKFTPNAEIRLANQAGLLKYNVFYRLKPGDNITQVICTTEVEPTSNAFVFSKPILKLLAKRELQTDLKALKIAVEHGLK